MSRANGNNKFFDRKLEDCEGSTIAIISAKNNKREREREV